MHSYQWPSQKFGSGESKECLGWCSCKGSGEEAFQNAGNFFKNYPRNIDNFSKISQIPLFCFSGAKPLDFLKEFPKEDKILLFCSISKFFKNIESTLLILCKIFARGVCLIFLLLSSLSVFFFL